MILPAEKALPDRCWYWPRRQRHPIQLKDVAEMTILGFYIGSDASGQMRHAHRSRISFIEGEPPAGLPLPD